MIEINEEQNSSSRAAIIIIDRSYEPYPMTQGRGSGGHRCIIYGNCQHSSPPDADVEDLTPRGQSITNLNFLANDNQIEDSKDNDFNSTINFNLVQLDDLKYTETEENIIPEPTNDISNLNNDEYTDITNLDIFPINLLTQTIEYLTTKQLTQREDFINIDDFSVFHTNDLSISSDSKFINNSVNIESATSPNFISHSTFYRDNLSVIFDL